MPCNRCGGRLVEYELRGRVSTVCEECESIDVLVEHDPPDRTSESWNEALERFYEQTRETDDRAERGASHEESVTDDPTRPPAESAGEHADERKQAIKKVSKE